MTPLTAHFCQPLLHCHKTEVGDNLLLPTQMARKARRGRPFHVRDDTTGASCGGHCVLRAQVHEVLVHEIVLGQGFLATSVAMQAFGVSELVLHFTVARLAHVVLVLVVVVHAVAALLVILIRVFVVAVVLRNFVFVVVLVRVVVINGLPFVIMLVPFIVDDGLCSFLAALLL